MSNHLTLQQGERIFYLSDLLYFSEVIDFTNPLSVEVLIHRVQNLLVLFDRVLLSPEHIQISTSSDQVRFKERFFASPVIAELIATERIIISLWGVCGDISEHIDASKRYQSVVGIHHAITTTAFNALRKITPFKRDQGNQSRSAQAMAVDLGWKYGNSTELLRYEDGKIVIPFSHEHLLIGAGAKVFTDKTSVNAAKIAYFRAMSSGNGGVFRSLVSSLETAKGEAAALKAELLPPACFTAASVKQLFGCIGFSPTSVQGTNSLAWTEQAQRITQTAVFRSLLRTVFQALAALHKSSPIATESDFKERIKYLKFVQILDTLATAESLFHPMKFVQKLGQLWSKQQVETYHAVPSKALRDMNQLIAKSTD